MIHILMFAFVFGYVYEDIDSLIIQNDSLVICGLHQYNIKVHISQNSKLKVRQWSGAADSLGTLRLDAPLIILENQSSIQGAEYGYLGANMNSHPAGYGPGGGGAGGVSGGGGGGGAYGGNGGDGGDYYPGTGGNAYGDPGDTIIDIGSGGGGGRLSVLDGYGGNGGAQVFLRAQSILIDSSVVTVNGQRGHDGSVEAGGGGAGGSIMLWADTISLFHAGFSADGANGGDASYGAGGGAGGGRIKIFYTSYLDTSDLSISVQGGLAGAGIYGYPEPGSQGSIHIEQVLDIQEQITNSCRCFYVHPRVTGNCILVSISDPPIQLSVYNASGGKIRKFFLKNMVNKLHLDDLAPGVYFLKSETADQKAEKIIIVK
jgi:hypothetical protein